MTDVFDGLGTGRHPEVQETCPSGCLPLTVSRSLVSKQGERRIMPDAPVCIHAELELPG
ncbi:MAG: hypothetical protein LUF04_13090 [Bacteroides sp.]|nr:hypothetical protein [Bacteroides sp.]